MKTSVFTINLFDVIWSNKPCVSQSKFGNESVYLLFKRKRSKP